MSSKKRAIDPKTAKAVMTKHAKALTQRVKRAGALASNSVKRFEIPSLKRRARARDASEQLRQYANLNGRSTPKQHSKKETKRRRRAEYLASLPKHPLKRLAYRLHPKRFFRYWISRDGAKMALKVAGIGFLVGLVVIVSVFAYFRRELQGIDPRTINFNQSARLYDRTGQTLLFTYGGDEQRIVVELGQISNNMQKATIAIEDKDFYKHGGFSVPGITRAVWNNITNRDGTSQGGSTITQQFIKNAVIKDRSQTYTRKIKELILAIELERAYSKDDILSFYLNQIPYGALEYGVEAAALGFFNKSAKDLTIDEAALLAAIPQAPSYYSPYGENIDDLVGRQHYIIGLMRDQGYISNEEAESAKQTDTLAKIIPIESRSAYRNIKAPHFVLKVVDDLIKEFTKETVQNGGLNVITTLDLTAQQIAEDVVRERYEQGGAMGDNAAIVAEDVPTGQVIAYVGSRDFNYPGFGAFDAATPDVGRQPGSSFKPYAYAEMFKNPRWGPGSIIWDSPTNFNGYAPRDFDGRFPGPMTIREAIGRSRNIPAVKALYIAGVDKTIELAQNMGLNSLCDTCSYGLSLVLGSGEIKLSEHVHGFGTFARGGLNKPQTYVIKVTNGEGETLKEWQDGKDDRQVLDPQIAYSITSILIDDVARAATFGRGSRLVIPGYTVAAKTGTTDLSVDGWLMGYSRYVAAGVWVGNHDSKPMYTFSEPMTGPIWHNFMVRYHAEKENLQFETPEGIKSVRIDKATGRNATDKSIEIINDIAPGWFKGASSGEDEKVVIDTISNKLATECTPELARKEVTNTGIVPELDPSDPMFSAWAKGAGYDANSTQIKEKDDVHNCDDARPSVTNFSVVGSAGLYEFSADYNEGEDGIETVNFYVNGVLVHSCEVPSTDCGKSSSSYSYVSDFSGAASVKVEVIDKLLYHDDATENTSFSKYDSSIIFISPLDGQANSCGFTCSIDWQNVNNAQKYEVCYAKDGGSNICQDITNSIFSFVPTGTNYTVSVTAKKNNGTVLATGSITFSA